MKLAIEHLQQTVAITERALTVSRDAMKAAQRQLDEHTAAADRNTRKLADLNAALAELRKPVASERATVIDQIVKTEIQAAAQPVVERNQPRATLSRKGN